MNVLTILGSPLKNGKTSKVLDMVEHEFITMELNVERVNLSGLNINGCGEDMLCHTKGGLPVCHRDDDITPILGKIVDADIVIFATPLFMWSYTAQMKALLDRTFCLVTGFGTDKHKSLVEGKRWGLLVTCAGPYQDNAESVVEIFYRIGDFAKTVIAADLVVPFSDTIDQRKGEVRNEAIIFAEKMAEK